MCACVLGTVITDVSINYMYIIYTFIHINMHSIIHRELNFAREVSSTPLVHFSVPS